MTANLFDQLKGSNRLPSPPGVALRILELAQSDDTSLEDLAGTISSDPALTGRILRFINSPMGATGCRVASLDDAVNRIGFRGVQLMALSFSLIASGRIEGCPSFDFKMFWSRSLACAVASKLLAKTTGRQDPDEAFIIGLLHRIGQMAMACAIPDQYERVLQTAVRSPKTLLEIEEETLGASHLAISARLLQDWRLPDSIWQSVIAELPSPDAQASGAHAANALLLHAAELTAALLCDSKAEQKPKVDEILRLMQSAFGMSAEEWSGLYDQIAQEWSAYGKLLSVEAGTDKSFRDLQEDARDRITSLSLATQLENLGMREANRQLLQKTRLDGLTGVANRHSFEERLTQEIKRAQHLHGALALCMIDIDHFKQFNDNYGHQVGDMVLKVVANTLDGSIRKMDLLARYGGEEFVVIAPDFTPNCADAMFERLREAVENLRLEHQGRILRVQISIGVAFAAWPHQPKTAKELVKAADDYLYAAKRAGRNRCMVEPTPSRAA